MKIGVGINENVVLSKVGMDDKGRMYLKMREAGKSKGELSPFEEMNAAEVIEDEEFSITFWPPKLPDVMTKDKKERTEQERGDLVNNDIKRLKNQFQQILEQYMTKDNIKWDVFAGVAITKETYFADLLSQNNLDVIYKNLTEQFQGMIEPFLGKDELAVRFKLVRQSRDKHYARVPDRYINDNPFIEPMTVPAEQSRVKFTAYEKREKLDDPTPVSREQADNPAEETPEAANVFGNR